MLGLFSRMIIDFIEDSLSTSFSKSIILKREDDTNILKMMKREESKQWAILEIQIVWGSHFPHRHRTCMGLMHNKEVIFLHQKDSMQREQVMSNLETSNPMRGSHFPRRHRTFMGPTRNEEVIFLHQKDSMRESKQWVILELQILRKSFSFIKGIHGHNFEVRIIGDLK